MHCDAPREPILFNIVYEAQNSAREAIKPGMTAGEVDTLARKVIQYVGYGEYFFHRTSHGIGIGTHEEPSVRFDLTLHYRKEWCFLSNQQFLCQV